MFLSDVSIRRPVLATVFSLLLVVFGIISFERLPVREFPDIDPPVVSVETLYPGAAANVVETRITDIIRWNAAVMVHRAQRPGIGVDGTVTIRRGLVAIREAVAGFLPVPVPGAVLGLGIAIGR